MSKEKEYVKPSIGDILMKHMGSSEKVMEPKMPNTQDVAKDELKVEESGKAESDKKEGVEKDEKTVDSKEGVEGEAGEAEPKEKEKTVSLKALQEERRKRRALQLELDELKKKSGSEGDSLLLGSADAEGVKPAASSSDIKVLERLAHQSCDLWAEVKADAQEMFDIFDEHAEEHPEYYAQFLHAPNPAKFAYSVAKKIKFEKEYGSSPEEVEKKIREKVMQESKTSIQSPKEMLKSKKEIKQPKNLNGSSASGEGEVYNRKSASEFWK